MQKYNNKLMIACETANNNQKHFEQDDSAEPTTGPQTLTKEERERKDTLKDGVE